MPVTARDAFLSAVRHAHDIDCLSWRKIALVLKEAGFDVKAGTLCTFAKTGKLSAYKPPRAIKKAGWLDYIPTKELAWMLENRKTNEI